MRWTRFVLCGECRSHGRIVITILPEGEELIGEEIVCLDEFCKVVNGLVKKNFLSKAEALILIEEGKALDRAFARKPYNVRGDTLEVILLWRTLTKFRDDLDPSHIHFFLN